MRVSVRFATQAQRVRLRTLTSISPTSPYKKTAPGYDKESGCKWLIDCLKRYMVTVHGQEAVNQMFFEMQLLIIRTLQAVQKVMMSDKHCFELYGYDIMIDDTLKPWLIEVNASPSLTADTASDHELKCGLLDDLLDVIDIEEKRTGDETQIGGFDLIFNGSHVRPSRPMAVQSCLGCYNDRISVKQKAQRELLKARAAQQASK